MMDGNKDEALRCVEITETAIASGNKQRALKFIRLAQRLDHTLEVDDLLVACEKLGTTSSSSSTKDKLEGENPNKPEPISNSDRSYTDEHLLLIREIKRNKDYYAILGIEKNCSVEEIRRAYRKLSLKVHPDKNKAPGAEEAFKIVCKAFKCLSDEELRRQYDQTGLVEEFEFNQQQHNVRRRRRRNNQNLFDEDLDSDEIFRAFFYGTQGDVFRNSHVYRTRGMGTQQRASNVNGGGFHIMNLLQMLPILIIFLVAYLPFSEPDYSLQKTYSYQIPKVTEKYGVEFFVKSSDFDQHFPQGSPGRENLEDHVVREYKNMVAHYCHIELQRRHWARNYPTPHCDKLQKLQAV